ncbi:protein phosphatase 1 regulatory subunit 17 [Rana temporaria]|uniref:protein phosphatase 1 regulatory subunit 17 n=1 Tax=Rana temporaria TaxID=8407 RepID=UPI001AAD4B5A|nr:protein phosphatase 1 regulatory subunit 17 [Rana temporaria]XP_040209206.1 protein phosphatase 1 regulatory subunit 17 [Rana temporaria]
MSTEFVPPLDISEDILDKREQHCKLLENLSEQLMRNCDLQMKVRSGKNSQVSTVKNELDQKQPRRKDTPAFNKPPFVPDFSEILLKKFDEIEKQQTAKISPVLSKEPNLMKPRRKDTPALHTSPLLPGGKLLKEDSGAIIVESEENDG